MADRDGVTAGRRFGYAVDPWFRPLVLPFGFRPSRDGVTLEDDTLVATFGFLTVRTGLDNISGAHVTRDYRWWTSFGIRTSWTDDGLTFGTNHDAGVCIHFDDKVPSPLRRSGHSALTVTVQDLAGLAEALGGDGTDGPDPEAGA